MPSSPLSTQAAEAAEHVDGVPVGEVVRPQSTAEVADVMKDAAAQRLSVVVRGAGTKLTWGAPPRSADLLLDLGGMSRVLEHEAGDLIVSAQAGTPLAELQRIVGRTDQRLGVDEVVPGTTLGGLVATNVSGPRRVALGTVRDLLIGVTVVRADGVVARAGGKVVKNVAGYDLGKLMVGSYGTLAVITEATFRLHPAPEASVWSHVQCGSPADATDLVAAVVDSQIVPAAVEIDAERGHCTVSVLVEGTRSGVEQRSAAAGLIGAPAARASAPGIGLAYDGSLLKITTQISSATEIAQAAVDLDLHVRGSVGAGVLYASTSDAQTAVTAVSQLRPLAAARGGALVLVDAPAEVKSAVDLWGPVAALDLMRRVKHEFDPENRLAPGRFVGGI
ncbi:FAD-binding oxidoreductase [Luteipulveratus sp. YIM 133132]|uniref:FAD-binding oxidoreductase n=1 Tax=Luteipulveratus flavus TaxID=3031728 RepID=UPI0023B1C668|nr:FAD-binding oxidoreductase [Luteipulveratus sp. YIM 133132]MDE9367590.1 FAD-binding oxidoreductase [Luteipulveratus sp. YIM 133132]